MSKNRILLLSFLVFFVSVSARAQTKEYKPFQEPYARAIVRVLIPDVGICTGFVVAKQKVVTARHCFSSQTRPKDIVVIYDSPSLPIVPMFAIVSRFATIDIPKKIYDVYGKDGLLSEDFLKGNDFILLHTDPLNIEPLNVIKKAKYKEVSGASVTVAGYPAEANSPWSHFPPLVYHPQDCKVQDLRKPIGTLPEANCYTSGGNSGGPVIVYVDGMPVVVGIVSGGDNFNTTFLPITDEFIQRFR